MQPEARFWGRIRKILSQKGHLSRIENLVDPGTPDTSFCFEGFEGFLELKYLPTLPPNERNSSLGSRGLRPSQILWIRQRIKHGGRVGVLVGIGSSIYFFDGSEAPNLNDLKFRDYPPGRPIKAIIKILRDWRTDRKRSS